MENREEIGKALGKIPSGVGILTAKSGSQETGMLASWFQQVAFEPPMILISVNKTRPILELISASRHFTLNLFHTNQKDLFAHFGKGFEKGREAFTGLSVTRKKSGNAILSDALAYLECEVTANLDAGDHVVFLGKVLDGGLLKDGPIMVHTRKDGFRY
jgi:flavin reductase (DIM6/NTAB) family NADH-FMN oxidoreductase RutF